jgi:hypothetical protein
LNPRLFPVPDPQLNIDSPEGAAPGLVLIEHLQFLFTNSMDTVFPWRSSLFSKPDDASKKRSGDIRRLKAALSNVTEHRNVI